VGAAASAPILFDLLEAVSAGSDRDFVDPVPSDLVEIDVCEWSGYPATDACQDTRKAHALRTAVPTTRDPFHLRLEIDLDTGLAVAPGCREGRRTGWRYFMVLPPEVRRHLAAFPLPAPPAYAPECRPSRQDPPPRIVSPPPNQTLRLLPGLEPEKQEVPLRADTGRAGETLSWFVDGAFVGRAPAEKRLWWTPSRGAHEILVMDAQGRADRTELRVR
jgi:penicillin-binding protein 1C